MNKGSRFEQAAAEWDNNPGRVNVARAVGEAVGRAIPLQPNWRVLDYGAGTGLLTLNLQPRVASLVALDSSKGMLEKLAQKLQKSGIDSVQTHHWDLATRAFPETGFDLVVSSMTFHHLRDVPLILERLTSLLKPGGWLAIADLDTEDGSFHGDAPDVFHRGFARSQISEWFVQAGLSRVSVNDAHLMRKESATGESRSYSIFLAIGQKGAG